MPNKSRDVTYAEAEVIAQALAIRSRSDYKARYREDLRPPSNPYKIYADTDWTNLANFLGKEKPSLYTYAHAIALVQVLGIKYSAGRIKRESGNEARYHGVLRFPFNLIRDDCDDVRKE